LVAQHWDGGDEAVRTQLLVSLVVTHLVLAYVARSDRVTFGRGWARNRALLATIAASLGLQVAMLTVPALRSALRLEVLPVRGWALAACSAAVVVGVIDTTRIVWRRVKGGRPPDP
jgi:Ca2+-transporting ATPase